MEPATIVSIVIGVIFIGVIAFRFKNRDRTPSNGSGSPIRRDGPPREEP